MRTAIIYYSMSGNTEYVAKKIAENLRESGEVDLIPITPKKLYPNSGFRKFFWAGKSAVMEEKPSLQPYSFEPEKYDRIIFGSPVWASNFTPPLRTFIEENPEINKKKIAAFVCFSGGGGEKALEKLRKCLGIQKYDATMILTDPKEKQKKEDSARIRKFCEELTDECI